MVDLGAKLGTKLGPSWLQKPPESNAENKMNKKVIETHANRGVNGPISKRSAKSIRPRTGRVSGGGAEGSMRVNLRALGKILAMWFDTPWRLEPVPADIYVACGEFRPRHWRLEVSGTKFDNFRRQALLPKINKVGAPNQFRNLPK